MRYLLALLLLTACATKQQTVVQELEDGYSRVEGIVKAIEWAHHGERLIIYLKQDNGVVLSATAENGEKTWVLTELAEKLKDNKYRLGLIGTENVEEYEEVAAGVEFIIIAVHYYDPVAEGYVAIMTDYGERASDTLRQLKWSSMFLWGVKKGLKAAVP